VILGARPYGDNLYNTGRETFLLPVRWVNGWPIILAGDDVPVYLKITARGGKYDFSYATAASGAVYRPYRPYAHRLAASPRPGDAGPATWVEPHGSFAVRLEMSIRPCTRRPMSLARFPALVLMAALTAAPRAASGQTIQIKTLPIADGDQWRFFPSANLGLGGVSIALPDSQLDPLVNPAKGARLSDRGRGLFFGSPTFYSISHDAGGGRTLPLGGIIRSGSNFGGLALALQEVDPTQSSRLNAVPPPVAFAATNARGDVATGAATVPAPGSPSRQNRFAFGTIGHVFGDHGLSVGASALWSSLHQVDGVDLLYAGSQDIRQHGGALDLRVGALKEWRGGRALEAMVLHDRFDMAHDVTWPGAVWDPNTRSVVNSPRLDHNLDRTNTWGLHLAYSQPFADAGWRVGAIATTNLMSHPKLPDYQIAQVQLIPWDPGRSAAYDLGVGIGKATGLTTFGVDAIYEPIRTHTWGESPDSIVTDGAVLPAGSKTTENWFHFSNAILRTGVGREIPLDSLRSSVKSIRLEAGLVLRSIGYHFSQLDHVAQSGRTDDESWSEWTKTWGFAIRFTDLEMRYVGRVTTGAGRPVVSSGGVVFAAAGDTFAGNFLAPPSGQTSLTGVAVTTHQISVSIPVR